MATMYPPQNNSPIARTASTISAAATTITVDDGSILPSAPNVLTLGTGEDAELVLMTAKSTNILTVTRGYNGTTAAEWVAGTACYRAITAQDVSALQENVGAKQDKVTASGILKGNGSGTITAAVGGTDYARMSDIPSVPSAYTSTPAMDGTGSAGSSSAFARGDHVHPTDTSRQAKVTASGLLKGNGSGTISAAVAGTDYQAPLSAYTSNPVMDGTASAGSSTAYAKGDHRHPTDTSRQAAITASGILKGDGEGGISAATAGTDYQAPLSAYTSAPPMDGTGAAGSSTAYSRGDHVHPTDTSRQAKITASGILKGDGNGGVSAAVSGTDYQAPLTAGTDYEIPYIATGTITTITTSPVTATISDTFNDVAAAYTAGKRVWLSLSAPSSHTYVLPLTHYYSTSIRFAAMCTASLMVTVEFKKSGTPNVIPTVLNLS